jgi:Family of unknown function (DUF6494)
MPSAEKSIMHEEKFNMTIRTFLKEVGVTSQREIEKTVREAIDSARITPQTKLHAKMTLEIPAVGLVHVVEGEIEP